MNPGPFTCKANALPLSYIPYLLQHSKILIDGSKILVCITQYKCYYWYNVLVYKHGLYCAFCAFWLIFSGKSHKIRYLENKKSFLFPFNRLCPKLVGSTKKCYYWFFENLKSRNWPLFWPFLIKSNRIKKNCHCKNIISYYITYLGKIT